MAPFVSNVIPMHENRLMGAALSYLQLGWHILPCWWIEAGACACGNPKCMSPGKHPIAKCVPKGQSDAATSPDVVREWWGLFPKANIAVFLQPSGLCAIDIDPRNGGYGTMDDIEAKYGPLVSDLLQFTGGGGEHRLFESPQGQSLPGKLGAGVDVKLNGYAMLEPSNHMSGKEYAWEASSDPRDGVIASPLPDWVRDLAGPKLPNAVGLSATKTALVLPQELRELISEALLVIPSDDRDVWLHVGMALHATDDLQWSFLAWDSWSQSSKKYDPVDQVRVWYSFKSDKGEKNLTYNTIFSMANQARSKQKVVVPIIELVALTKEVVMECVDLPAVVAKRFPVESLNELSRWFDASFDETHAVVSQGAVLSVMCCAASRRYVSPYGDPASCYFAVLSPSVTQARYAHMGADQVLFDAGMRSMLRTTRMNSPQQLYSTLHRSPACLYLADDYGDQLRYAKRQPSGLLDQTLSLLTGRVYQGQALTLDNWQELGLTKGAPGEGAQPVIYAPALTTLAVIAGSQLSSLFKSGEFARGAADAFVFLPALEADDWRQCTSQVRPAVPSACVDVIRRLRGFAVASDTQMSAEQIFGGTGGIAPTPQIVQFTGDVQGVQNAWIAGYAKRGPQVRQLASGARKSFVRLCVAMAAWANPTNPIATSEIVQWCAEFVQSRLDASIEQANLRSSDDEDKPDIYQRVLEFIDQYGADGVAKRDLHSRFKAFRALAVDKRDALVEQMLNDEAIVMVPTASGRGKVLVRAVYIKVTQ